jgi:hypothetical protein
MLYGRISKGVRMIRFLCPYCREKNNVADNLEGKQSTCTACNRDIPVPFRDDFSSVLPDEAVAKSNFDQTLDKHPRMKFYRFMQSFLDVSFDELSIFIMSSSFLLLFCISKVLRQDIYKLFRYFHREVASSGSDREVATNTALLVILSVVTLLPFIIGLFVSIYNVFTDREKGPWTKYFMVSFAWLMSLIGGFACGFHMLVQAYIADIWFLTIFPLINLANTILLLIKFHVRFGHHRKTPSSLYMTIDESIKDDDTTVPEVMVASAVSVFVILITTFAFGFHWSVAFSICTVYAINFCKYWNKLLHR